MKFGPLCQFLSTKRSETEKLKYVPLHLAQMNEVKQKDPETWEALEKGSFVVARTGISLTDLFVDQALEQKIRQLKAVGGITGITQITKHLIFLYRTGAIKVSKRV